MVKLTNFQIFWLLFFGIPLILGVIDNRLFLLPMGFLVFEIWRLWTHFTGGEWVPTPQKIVYKMLKIANVKKDDVVYDLGSGTGNIVLSAAKIGANATGVELDFLRVLLSKIKIKLAKLDKRAKIVHGNLFKADVKDADVITLFLLPKTMGKLEEKLKKEIKRNARIVSYRFTFKKWEPVKVDEENKIYLYKF